MDIEPEELGRLLIKSLSMSQKCEFKMGLIAILASYPGKSGKGLTNAWVSPDALPT